MKDLLSSGLGTKVNQADSILPKSQIWDKGVFGDKSAESLQCTMFFYTCKLFGLRGHDEYRSLTCEQFNVGRDANGKYVEFSRRSSKTYNGGLKNLKLSNKQIRHYSLNGIYLFVLFFSLNVVPTWLVFQKLRFLNSPFCGASDGKFVILSHSKSCHINRMKICIEIKKIQEFTVEKIYLRKC